jgi:hypothetical protein
LIEDIVGLTKRVCGKIDQTSIQNLKKRIDPSGHANITIEQILSHIRLLIEVIGNTTIDNFDKDKLETLEKEICSEITAAVSQELPNKETSYNNLASWIAGISRTTSVEIFTPNYDLLIEEALEVQNIPYFDGFIGSKKAFFDLHSIEQENLPSRWVKLWKLHGSINWWNDSCGNVFRCHYENSEKTKNKQMIYPSHIKYSQSRRMPYLAMQDRLGRFLSSGQSILIICGYSFSDQHINEILVQRLAANPRAICFGLLYDDLEKYKDALENAKKVTNLCLISQDSAFFSKETKKWRSPSGHLDPTHQDYIEDDKCKLGNFEALGKFLQKQTIHENMDRNHA